MTVQEIWLWGESAFGIFLGENATCLFRYIVKAEHDSAILCYHLKITESVPR